MRTLLRLAAGAVALLILPTMTQALAAPVGSSGTLDPEAISALPASVDAPSLTPHVTPVQMSASGAMPSRGMTMAQVEQAYGAPVVRKAPVGSPPITRWEYAGFVVYFEYRHVIHSVASIAR